MDTARILAVIAPRAGELSTPTPGGRACVPPSLRDGVARRRCHSWHACSLGLPRPSISTSSGNGQGFSGVPKFHLLARRHSNSAEVSFVSPSYSPKIAYLRALGAFFAGHARRSDRIVGWRRGGSRFDFAWLYVLTKGSMRRQRRGVYGPAAQSRPASARKTSRSGQAVGR
jgi:hypothetical protein